MLRIYIGCWLKRKHCVDFFEVSVRGNKSCPLWEMQLEWEYPLLESLDEDLELPGGEESCQSRRKKIKQQKSSDRIFRVENSKPTVTVRRILWTGNSQKFQAGSMGKDFEQEMGRSHYNHSKCWFSERTQIGNRTNSCNPIIPFNTMSSKNCNVWTGFKNFHNLTCKRPSGLPLVNCKK